MLSFLSSLIRSALIYLLFYLLFQEFFCLGDGYVLKAWGAALNCCDLGQVTGGLVIEEAKIELI
jgi:membrane associated rhomboid family serine protease